MTEPPTKRVRVTGDTDQRKEVDDLLASFKAAQAAVDTGKEELDAAEARIRRAMSDAKHARENIVDLKKASKKAKRALCNKASVIAANVFVTGGETGRVRRGSEGDIVGINAVMVECERRVLASWTPDDFDTAILREVRDASVDLTRIWISDRVRHAVTPEELEDLIQDRLEELDTAYIEKKLSPDTVTAQEVVCEGDEDDEGWGEDTLVKLLVNEQIVFHVPPEDLAPFFKDDPPPTMSFEEVLEINPEMKRAPGDSLTYH